MKEYTSARLRFEPIRESHADEVAHALCDPKVYAFIDEPCPDIAGLRTAFRSREAGSSADRAAERWVDLLVRLASTGEAIGRIEATVIDHNAEVAYLLGRTYWGKSYGYESLVWLHSLLATEYGATALWATVHPNNARSIRLLERTGYALAPRTSWPLLTSYDPGDRVYTKAVNVNTQ